MPLQCRNQIWPELGGRCRKAMLRVWSAPCHQQGKESCRKPLQPWTCRSVQSVATAACVGSVEITPVGAGGGWLLFTKVRLPKVACTAHNTIHTPSLTNYARFSLCRGRGGGGGGGVEIVVTDRHGGMVGLLMSMPCFISQPAPTLLFCRTLSLSVRLIC